MQAPFNLGYNQSMVFSRWSRFDEMEEVSGERHAEMLGANHITFAYHNGDEAILKAKPDTQPARKCGHAF